MNTRKKFGALLLSCAALGTLAACSSGSDDAKKTDESGSKSEESFKVTTVRWSDWGDDFQKGFLEESAKDAGVKINWDVYVNADWGDKKAVLLAGGDLPDAFLGSITLTDAELAQNQGMFIALDEYIEKDMPNLSAALAKEPKLKALITSPDGHIYSLPKKLPMRPEIANQLFINKQWLDNLGLEMPDTYEDFINVLTAFKEQDANGNGDVNDEIPYGAGNFDPTFSFILPFDNRLGIDGTYEMSLKDDKPVYLRTEDSYKDGIAWMHDAYAKGLIDSELFTQDQSMSDAKRMDKDVSLVGVSVGWTADATFGLHADEYVALTPLAGPDGNRYVFSDPDHYNYGRNEFMVTTACEDPAALLKWADSFYTDDASIQTYYGSFGIGTEKDGDNYQVLPPQNDESADSWAWINSLRDFGPKYIEDGFNDRVTIDDTQGDGLKLKLDAEVNEYALPGFPNVTYSNEELSKLSSIYVDISSYVTQMASKWIVEGGVEEEWADYLKQLDSMGIKDFMQIQNDAYDRYVKTVGE
ncbi:extracellular solute-binding protein [Enterococcus nangangensis]|uniref:extracellular solute-binding protein n=1 Tax=Enterococcus nangangensis TaxID=2559926 RepID=UPI0010FA1102|nr:extracellular solute-binding protein [Enterococcus nangangensis]